MQGQMEQDGTPVSPHVGVYHQLSSIRGILLLPKSQINHKLTFSPLQEWQAFPNHWNNQGHFKTDGDPLSGPSEPSNDDPSPRPSRPLDVGDVDVASGLSSEDDRAGMLKHPTRGTILTYIFEVRGNNGYCDSLNVIISCFFQFIFLISLHFNDNAGLIYNFRGKLLSKCAFCL